jgi:hypothetical protein
MSSSELKTEKEEKKDELQTQIEAFKVPLIELLLGADYDPLAALFSNLQSTIQGFENTKQFYPLFRMIMNFIQKIQHSYICEELSLGGLIHSSFLSLIGLKDGEPVPDYRPVSACTAKFYGGLELGDCSPEAINEQVVKLLLGNYQLFTSHISASSSPELVHTFPVRDALYGAAKKIYAGFAALDEKGEEALEHFVDPAFLSQFQQWKLSHTTPIPLSSTSKETSNTAPLMNGSYSVKTGNYSYKGFLPFVANKTFKQKPIHTFDRVVHTICDLIVTVILPRNQDSLKLMKTKQQWQNACTNIRETPSYFIIQYSYLTSLVLSLLENKAIRNSYWFEIKDHSIPKDLVDDYAGDYVFDK